MSKIKYFKGELNYLRHRFNQYLKILLLCYVYQSVNVLSMCVSLSMPLKYTDADIKFYILFRFSLEIFDLK